MVNFKLQIKFIFLLFAFTFSTCRENEYYKRPSVISGYKTGTLFDVHFFAYSDLTYYYSNSDKGEVGKWEMHGDTLILKQIDTIQAVLIGFKPYKIYNPRYNWLYGMEFIENNPAKIVKFPKHN